MSDQQESDFGGSWELIPLTPKYLPEEHGHYVDAIETALANDQIHNIALSGNFGVGKSSILQEIALRHVKSVLKISLSTLAPIGATKLDESAPIQATTPTNRIQQEIVKQLIYREDPSKTPASRFRRIERFQFWREIWSSALLGFAIAIIFLLAGWTAKLANAFHLGNMGVWKHLLIWGIATGMVQWVRWQFYGRLQIKQLSAGSAVVSLDETSVSYFDQYLDEIVYFFEVSGRNLVIFEDIDRFNDSQIFETLRALNTLLNASSQIKKPICFIYAIKDSIFDHIGLIAEASKLETDVVEMDTARAEAERANRTKFFDLVIPVVPFITHRSARNLAVQLLNDIKHEVAPELLDLAAQYVPDMRLLKNVRNEFIVFHDRIFSGDGEQLNLSESDLFAMMLYKSTYLTDFEAIRHGKSKLDALYKVSRKLVTENIEKLVRELRGLRQQITRINGAAARSTQLGEQLLAHVQRTAQAVSYHTQNATYSVAGVQKSLDDLKGMKFWAEFTALGGNPELLFQNNHRQILRFNREDLAAALGDSLDAERWDEADRNALNQQLEAVTEKINFLRSADFVDLLMRPEFFVNYNGNKLSSFAEVALAILMPGLAYQLVRAGYINRNFTLYTSTFHGDRVGSVATNFIIHHVERDLMDEYFKLAPNDVDALVRERGKSALEDPALYNIAILDHLLTKDIDAADIMVRSLVSLGESQTRFMQAYLAAGEQRLGFIKQFTAVSSRVLIYLVKQTDLDDSSRLELVNVALASLSMQKQSVEAAVSGYLSSHYAEFTTLTSDATGQPLAERIAELFADANITVPRLAPLGLQVRTSFVSRNLFGVTHENLAIAIGNTTTVALDVIREANETVYDYVLKHLSTYLSAIDSKSATVNSKEAFIAVIEDVLEHKTPLLGDVVERATPDCKVEDIAGVSQGAWPALAEHGRFPATFSNVSHYVKNLKSVDECLAKILTASREITAIDGADEDTKYSLAVSILAAKDHLPSAELRVALVASLHLDNYLDMVDVKAEVGGLFAQLLKHNIIDDAAETYKHLAVTDWPTRRAFICESKEFPSYMTPELLQSDLAALLKSSEISSEIKGLIVAQAEAYAEVADPSGLTELAQFVTRHGNVLAPDVVQKMAQSGVNSQQIVMLLRPHLQSISQEQLFAILQKLDGGYPGLTEIGRDKPRIPNTEANLALLKRLRQEGIVSKYVKHELEIEVHKKYTE